MLVTTQCARFRVSPLIVRAVPRCRRRDDVAIEDATKDMDSVASYTGTRATINTPSLANRVSRWPNTVQRYIKSAFSGQGATETAIFWMFELDSWLGGNITCALR